MTQREAMQVFNYLKESLSVTVDVTGAGHYNSAAVTVTVSLVHPETQKAVVIAEGSDSL